MELRERSGSDRKPLRQTVPQRQERQTLHACVHRCDTTYGSAYIAAALQLNAPTATLLAVKRQQKSVDGSRKRG